MITVEIPKKDLLQQLPHKAGYALLQWLDEMPSSFVFQALPVKTQSEVLAEKFPILRQTLTPTEWVIFLHLYGRGKVRYTTIACAIYPDEMAFELNSNVMHTHVKSIRAKLAYHGVLLHILTHRGSIEGEGKYEMREITCEEERLKVKAGGKHTVPAHIAGQEEQRPRVCGACRQSGHNTRTCAQAGD